MELNFKLSAGDTFVFSLLIPDQDPENILASERLPELVINNEKFTSDQKSNFKWTITFCFFTWLSRDI